MTGVTRTSRGACHEGSVSGLRASLVHRCRAAYARHGRHGSGSAPRRSTARRRIRSPGTQASGSASARMATTSAVQGPTPGRASSRARVSSRSAPGVRSRLARGDHRGDRLDRPLTSTGQADAGEVGLRQRVRGGERRGEAAAVGAGGSGSPYASTSLVVSARAPASETCWEITVRTAASNPSTAPGTAHARAVVATSVAQLRVARRARRRPTAGRRPGRAARRSAATVAVRSPRSSRCEARQRGDPAPASARPPRVPCEVRTTRR